MKKQNTSQLDVEAKDSVAATNNNIRRFRAKKNISQQRMADALGISQNAYSEIGIGSTRLQLKTLFIRSKTLEVNISELIHVYDTPKGFKQE